MKKRFTDFMVHVSLSDGHFKQHHFKPFRPEQKVKARRLRGLPTDLDPREVYPYRGHNYHLNVAWAMDAPGYYPWVRFHWWNPFSFLKYIILGSYTRVGVLKFTEPPEMVLDKDGKLIPNTNVDGLIEPEHVSMSSLGMSPAKASARTIATHNDSSVWQDHERHRKIGGGLSSNMLFWVVIGLVFMIIVLYATGFIKIGGG